MTFEPTIPPPTPAGLIPAIGVICILAGVVLLAAYCGCSSPPANYPAYCADEKLFTARLLSCVDEAARDAKDEESFRAKSRACRAAVHERCGITTVGAKDGGAP